MPKIMMSVHAVFENEVPGFVVWMYAVGYGSNFLGANKVSTLFGSYKSE